MRVNREKWRGDGEEGRGRGEEEVKVKKEKMKKGRRSKRMPLLSHSIWLSEENKKEFPPVSSFKSKRKYEKDRKRKRRRRREEGK